MTPDDILVIFVGIFCNQRQSIEHQFLIVSSPNKSHTILILDFVYHVLVKSVIRQPFKCKSGSIYKIEFS